MNLYSIAFSLFLLMDPIGNIPFYISYLKDVHPKRQFYVILREMIVALLVILLFNFVGDALMAFLHIQHDTIQIAGGIILFLLCLRMIFPSTKEESEVLPKEKEPFIVPLAIPLIAGPSVLAAVMIYTRQEMNNWTMMGAILLAWFPSLLILLLSSFLKKILGWRGILALERLMGLILTLLAVQMFMSGVSAFMERNR